MTYFERKKTEDQLDLLFHLLGFGLPFALLATSGLPLEVRFIGAGLLSPLAALPAAAVLNALSSYYNLD